jgi:hypothetical protein
VTNANSKTGRKHGGQGRQCFYTFGEELRGEGLFIRSIRDWISGHKMARMGKGGYWGGLKKRNIFSLFNNSFLAHFFSDCNFNFI